jgi:excisionase family DNA binding protein
MERLLYPASEVAELLGVGLSTAKALIASGELRSVKINRSRRVPAEVLREYVQRLDVEQNPR